MRFFCFFARYLHRISKAASTPWFCQLVALLLFFPSAHLSEFFFKLAYSLNERRLRRICRKNLMLGGNDLLVKLDGLSLNLGEVLELL